VLGETGGEKLPKFDVLVIGAGVFGISSAYYIKKNSPEKRVLLVDRLGDAGQANTGRSNAMFRNTFSSVDNQMLANASIDYYLHVQDEMGIDVGVDRVGYLWLMTDAQLAAARTHLAKMESNGVEIRIYDRGELERMIPGFVAGPSSEEARIMSLGEVASGVFGAKCGRLAPDRLAGHYRDQFRALGGDVMFNTEAKQLVVSARETTGIDGEPFVWQDWHVTGARMADGTEISADTVVVAAGVWNNELLDPVGIDGHCKAKKRQLFTISVAGKPSLERLLRSGGFNGSGVLPMVILPKSGVMVKAVKESGEFWIGCEDEVNRPYVTYPEHDLDSYGPEPSYYEQNVYPILREYFPQFEGARPSRMWAGLYGYNTVDNMPYVFAESGLVVVGGDSGSGVMKGDSLGRIVDAVYRGGEEADAVLYDGTPFRASKLGFRSRDVEREDWLL
jgi:glycine/D-amino acid oxidase-like deaminating enzyme